jgi:uncharacterized protein DUF6600/FecR-like protein
MRIARALLTVLLFAALPAFQGGDRPESDPPSRVGRLSFLSGSVSFRPGSVDDWAAATLNYPLTTGDHLWTDADSRAELTVGTSAIRLAPQSAFGLLALDDRTAQLRLSQGSLNVRLRNLGDDETFEIDTPNGAVTLLRPGSYRVDVDSTGDTTTVTVRRGQAEVTAAGSAFTVRADQAALVSGTDSPSYDVFDALPPDNWEDWCTARDRRWDGARSAQYVSRETIGYEDLDEYGDWRNSGPYGPVWVPRAVVAGWAPYRFGHWAWVDPWGWTWIDDAPWGFAPFHYGRWVYVDGGWGWVPGRIVPARPVYAPALVVFVGGPSWGLAITARGGGGGVAWFPLAPDEPYVPAYHVSNTYVRNVNVTNVNVTNINVTNVNVTNITYRNRSAPGGMTVVSQETLVQSRPVGHSVIEVPRERLDQATVVGSTARVAPGRRSVLGQPEIVEVRRPPERVTTRTVVVRTTPPPPPVPFAAREQALRQHPGRPLDNATLASLRARAPAAQPNPLVRPAAPAGPATPANPVGPAGRAAQGNPAPALKPAREGLPPPRPLPAAGLTPQPTTKPGRRERPAPPSPAAPAPAPAAAPTAGPPAAGGEKPDRGQRRPPVTTPAPAPRGTPQPAARPTPAPAPAPAAAPAPPPAERPAPAAAKGREAARPPTPERRPEKEHKAPEKERKAEKDTAKEKGKPPR